MLLNNEYNLTTGIKIGMKKGAFSKLIFDGWKSCEKYHHVDLWAKEENYATMSTTSITQPQEENSQ